MVVKWRGKNRLYIWNVTHLLCIICFWKIRQKHPVKLFIFVCFLNGIQKKKKKFELKTKTSMDTMETTRKEIIETDFGNTRFAVTKKQKRESHSSGVIWFLVSRWYPVVCAADWALLRPPRWVSEKLSSVEEKPTGASVYGCAIMFVYSGNDVPSF